MKKPVCYHFHLNINIHHFLNVSNFQQRNFPPFSSRISRINRRSDLYNRGIFLCFGSSPISYSYFQNSEPNLFDILVKTLNIQFSNRGIFLRSVIQQFPFARIMSPFSYDENEELCLLSFPS